MATAGLTEPEVAVLEQAMARLDRVLEKRFLLGGREVAEMQDMANRIRVRLNPPTPSTLVDELERLLSGHKGQRWIEEVLAESLG